MHEHDLSRLSLGIHPHTGQPIRPLWIRPDGRVVWPILGASPDDTSTGGGDGTGGADGGGQAGSGVAGAPPAGGQTGSGGGDLGYPKDTPLTEMTTEQREAYWKHNSRRHEGRYKDLLGDRTPEQVKADLARLAQIDKESLTPADQALAERYERGKADGVAAERLHTAAAIFRATLESAGITSQDDLDDLSAGFNAAGFVTDKGIDTAKVVKFASRFTTQGATGSSVTRTADYGGGRRSTTPPERGTAGKAEAERRFGKKTGTESA